MVPRKFVGCRPHERETNPLQIWEFFLAHSTIISRQGSATCYQITIVKNLNSTHRVEGIPTQHGLFGALKSTGADLKAWAQAEAQRFPAVAN